ncbi:MAG: 37S ribosomal protein S22 [Vezdaea aestivalis]|nr:MAG: 37S ribosomal protein S22 [Vezdaea aestivalis]
MILYQIHLTARQNFGVKLAPSCRTCISVLGQQNLGKMLSSRSKKPLCLSCQSYILNLVRVGLVPQPVPRSRSFRTLQSPARSRLKLISPISSQTVRSAHHKSIDNAAPPNVEANHNLSSVSSTSHELSEIEKNDIAPEAPAQVDPEDLVIFADYKTAKEKSDYLLMQLDSKDWEALEAMRNHRSDILVAIREKQTGVPPTTNIRIDGPVPRDLSELEFDEGFSDDELTIRETITEAELGEQEVVDELDEETLEDDAQREQAAEQEMEADSPSIQVSANPETTRMHPWTLAGRFGTFPSTIHLPIASFSSPVSQMIRRVSMKHLQQAALTILGGPGFPHGPGTPKSKRPLLQKPLPIHATDGQMSMMDADVFMTTVMPQTYVWMMSTLVETRKRLGSQWLRDLLQKEGGPRVIDIGGGGSGIIAWRELVKAEMALMKEEGISTDFKAPFRQSTVITGSDTLRHRTSTLLDNTTHLPRMPDYLHVSANTQHPTYDVVLAPHSLWQHETIRDRRTQVGKIWNLAEPQGGVLVFVEKGVPKGFEAIAQARHQILKNYIQPGPQDIVDTENVQDDSHGDPDRKSTLAPGMIVAPCTNRQACPLYPTVGTPVEWGQFCHFNQRFTRPRFGQTLSGATHRNHEDAKFSYIAVRRGIDSRPEQSERATDIIFRGLDSLRPVDKRPKSEETSGSVEPVFTSVDPEPAPLSFPRVILPPLKRQGHVLMDLCTAAGKFERWTVPRSFSKQAFHDARKSSWGDLWGLGAKTRQARELRLPNPDTDPKWKNKTARRKFQVYVEKRKADDAARVWAEEGEGSVRKYGKGWERTSKQVEKRRRIKSDRNSRAEIPQSLDSDERLGAKKDKAEGEQE